MAIACGSFLAAAALPSIGQASIIHFDPDGSLHQENPASNVSSFSYLPGNLLIQNGLQNASIGQTFTSDAYFQARLGNLFDINSNALTVNNFARSSTANTGFEITAVATFTAVIQKITQNAYGIALSSGPSSSFKLYYDATGTRANDLTGDGFTDGTAILSGSITGISTSLFSLNGAGGALDQFGGVNNYQGITATKMGGNLNMSVSVGSEDASFFLDGDQLASMVFQSNLKAPFDAVDPSQRFAPPGTESTSFQPAFVSHNDGSVGGDVQLQTAANSSFFTVEEHAVPEPAMLPVLGLCLGLAGWRRRYSSANKASFANYPSRTHRGKSSRANST